MRLSCASPPSPMSAPVLTCPSESASTGPPESGMYVASMSALLVLTSTNALLSLEYLVGHNRTRELSQTPSTKQPSVSLAKSTA